jgi:hypothetical protein
MMPVAPVTVNGFSTLTALATCPAGKRAIGGGYEPFFNATLLVPVASHISGTDTWRVVLRNSSNTQVTNVQFKAYVICAAS